MKKILIAAALILAGFTASAQLRVGAGYLNTNFGAKNDAFVLNGVYAGVAYNIPIVEGLGIAPGAYFSWATGPLKTSVGKLGTCNNMAINIPVDVTYSMELGPGTAYAYVGPAFQYGLALNFDDGFTEWTLYKNNVVKPIDVKLGVGFGYVYGHLGFNVGFDWGLLDLNDGYWVNKTAHAINIHAGVAFVF